MVVVKRPCCLFCFDLRACMATQRSFPVVVPASRTPAHVLVRPGTSHSHNLLATVFFFSFFLFCLQCDQHHHRLYPSGDNDNASS